MTQTNVSVDRLAEFKALFSGLDEIGQEAAIIILKSLEFAQSVENWWRGKLIWIQNLP